MKKKNLMLGSVCLLGALTVTSCGNNSGATSDSGSSSSTSAGGVTTLSIDYFNGGHGSSFFEKLKDGFNAKYPDTPIELELSADSAIAKNMDAKLQTGAALPDLAFSNGGDYKIWAAKGYLANVDDAYSCDFSSTAGTVEDNLLPGYKNVLQYLEDGHYYSSVWADTVYGVAYNKTLFLNKGWKVPTTMDELTTLCAKIVSDTSGEVYPWAICSATTDYYLYPQFEWRAQVNGYDFEDAYYHSGETAVPKANFFSDGVKTAYDCTYKINVNGDGSPKWAKPHALDEQFHASQNHLLDGTCAMMCCGPWLMNELKPYADEMTNAPEIGVFRIPYVSNAKKDASGNYINIITDSPEEQIIIPAKATHVDMAKKFMGYINSEEGNIIFSNYGEAPRPFKYDYTKCDQCSDYAMDLYKAFFEADNRVIRYNSGAFWEAGANTPLLRPAQQIGQNYTADQCMSWVKGQVESQYDQWVGDMNL